MRLLQSQRDDRAREINRLLHTLRNERTFRREGDERWGLTLAINVLLKRIRQLRMGESLYSGARGAIRSR